MSQVYNGFVSKMPDLYISNLKDKNESDPAAAPIPAKTTNPFASFAYQPPKAHFETQEKEEKVVLLLRKHPITNLSWLGIVVLLILGSAVFSWLPFFTLMPGSFQFATYVLWYLLALAIAVEGLLTWFFNVNIITDERVVDVDFYTLIYREISDTQINKIQETTHKMGGFLGTFLNYGDVIIQTAGAVPNFEFSKVPKPAEVAKILQELQREEEKEALEGRVR